MLYLIPLSEPAAVVQQINLAQVSDLPKLWVAHGENQTDTQLQLELLSNRQDAETRHGDTGIEKTRQVGEMTSPNASQYETHESSELQEVFPFLNPGNAEDLRLSPSSTGNKIGQLMIVSDPVPGQSLWLITQDREGEIREYRLSDPQTPQPFPATEVDPDNVVEVTGDQQEYNEQQQVITAQGNVVVRFAQGILNAERAQINLANRIIVAQGNVVLKRGDQVLRGERFEYAFMQDDGVIYNANGEIYQPSFDRDSANGLSPEESDTVLAERPLSDRLTANQPLQRITTAEGYRFALGSIRGFREVEGDSGNQISLPSTTAGGQINRFRFQAERVDFNSEGWVANNIRLTNDPFSPPELEVRANTATFRNVEPLVDEVLLTNSRIVFDQSFSLPLFRDRLVFDRRPRQPSLVQFKFDGEDRGGLYIERSFDLLQTDWLDWSITPQYFLQRAIFEEGIVDPASFGFKSKLNVTLTPRTALNASMSLTSLDFEGFDLNTIDDELRGKIRLNQSLGDLRRPYNLSLEYNYRDRLFNGSLGFQTVQSSVGLLLNSPNIPLGNTGINLNYQASIQNINANTDRADLLSPNRENDRINLTRYQGAISLNRSFPLWQGKTLPATAEEGLRYTSVPVLPFLRLNTGITAVSSFYSNGDTQPSLNARIGLEGQIGHFSRPFLDYTGFNITFTQAFRGDESPFQFDRIADRQRLSLGISQQVYGPIRFGFQTSFTLDSSEEISTDYFLEYSRRTYNIVLRYNPVQELGSINLRISDFNWVGSPEPFEGTGIRPVVDGIKR